MKVRTGFVSNSSTSSFFVGYKDSFPSLKELINALASGISKESLFYPLVEQAAGYLLPDGAYIRYYHEPSHLDGDIPYEVRDLLLKGYKVYEGSVSSEGDPLEMVLCDLDINYESDYLVIIKEGGF